MNYISYPAIGIDLPIMQIQNVLHGHLGLQNVDYYGRVQRTVNMDKKSVLPTVQLNNSESKEVYYDDQKAPGGNVFFIESEDHTTKDGKLFTAEVSIVFMLNLNNIFPGATYRADSEIQDHAVKLIKRHGAMEITGIRKGISNIMKGFSVANIVRNNIQPYHMFAIKGNVRYMFNCK